MAKVVELKQVLAAVVTGDDGIVIDKVGRFNFNYDADGLAALIPVVMEQATQIPDQLGAGELNYTTFDFDKLRVILTSITQDFHLVLIVKSGVDYNEVKAEINECKETLSSLL